MKLGIMQPYLFPYIGYFQLINCSDLFVIYDDVQYINRGWINRNRLLNKGQPFLFTLSLKKDSSTLNINERMFSDDFDNESQKLLKSLEYFYSKAPHFRETMNLIADIFQFKTPNISEFISNQISKVCEHLDIKTPLLLSSKINRDLSLKGVDAIIDIVRVLRGDHYINPIGGTNLYSKNQFDINGIQLSFLKTNNIRYPQFNNDEFVSNLSIIDVLMFNSKSEISELLLKYELIK
ncbi:WbqC family protein [Paenibacillus lautus]|uniref:WbqC family protein n=1 Tax=Paenibacillus lautus TaxID=1401 RepID=UPI003D9A2DB9